MESLQAETQTPETPPHCADLPRCYVLGAGPPPCCRECSVPPAAPRHSLALADFPAPLPLVPDPRPPSMAPGQAQGWTLTPPAPELGLEPQTTCAPSSHGGTGSTALAKQLQKKPEVAELLAWLGLMLCSRHVLFPAPITLASGSSTQQPNSWLPRGVQALTFLLPGGLEITCREMMHVSHPPCIQYVIFHGIYSSCLWVH